MSLEFLTFLILYALLVLSHVVPIYFAAKLRFSAPGMIERLNLVMPSRVVEILLGLLLCVLWMVAFFSVASILQYLISAYPVLDRPYQRSISFLLAEVAITIPIFIALKRS